MRSLVPANSLLQCYRLCFSKFRNTRKFQVISASRFCSSSVYVSQHKKMGESVFRGERDRFGGITVDSESEICNISEFPKKLADSLEAWKQSEKRGIWFKVYLEHSEWVPILAQNGFKFHHAKEDFVMMYLWLPKDESCVIPPYASTMVGAGAVVVNDNNEILVVRERHWKAPHWKLPGGYAEPGENIVDAAIREVYEETNVLTAFHSFLSFRHTHNGMWDCSDLYMVVNLKPLSTEIKKCDRELVDAKWMPIEEYINHPDIHELNKFCVTNYLDIMKNNIKVECTPGFHPLLKKPYAIYFVKKQDEDQFKQ